MCVLITVWQAQLDYLRHVAFNTAYSFCHVRTAPHLWQGAFKLDVLSFTYDNITSKQSFVF